MVPVVSTSVVGRSTRPSVVMPGRFFHDHGVIRKGADGLLEMRMGGSGMVFEGHAKRVVAEIIQDGVECKAAALRDALEAALAE